MRDRTNCRFIHETGRVLRIAIAERRRERDNDDVSYAEGSHQVSHGDFCQRMSSCRLRVPVLNRRHWLKTVAALSLPVGWGSGCSLLHLSTVQTQGVNKPFLPPLPKPKDAVSVEIMLADRAAGDPMIGRPLWSNLNEVSATGAASRTLLERNGFQYGLSSSTPPFALESLLSADGKSATQRTQYLKYGFPSGGEHVVETWPETPVLEYTLKGTSSTTKKSLKSARCVYRIRVEKVEDAWGRLEFLPEIHYGPMIQRRVPSENGWLFQQSQEIEPIYDLRFSVELNTGELAVIGLKDQAEASLGHAFFRGAREGKLERVMMIRLADVFSVAPVQQFDRMSG